MSPRAYRSAVIKLLLLTVRSVYYSFCRLPVIILGFLAVALVVEAKEIEQVSRIGVLSPFSFSNHGPTNTIYKLRNSQAGFVDNIKTRASSVWLSFTKGQNR